MSDVKAIQRERLARRLWAIYVAEMTGLGSIDGVIRKHKLNAQRVPDFFLIMADDVLTKFHAIFLEQMDDKKKHPRSERDENDAPNRKPN